MSRSIAESLSLLSETLGNCKTNLKEKEVADVDNIKISDVDEKIAEIQSGGGFDEITSIITSIMGDYCLVVTQGSLEQNDYSVNFDTLRYGEQLDKTESNYSRDLIVFDGWMKKLYIGLFPCSWKKVRLSEIRQGDGRPEHAYTNEIDISKPGVILEEMR